MSYVVLARKYRPQTLEELAGQSHISRALTHAIEMDRVAHAFLFCGVRGTGKTSTARIVAKMLNCKNGPTPNPCGVCEACVEIAQGKAIDVREIDAASNRGINEMRALREGVNYPASRDRYRIYIIDEVHMLTSEAANAFLKTLEEPPKGVYFILATTDPQRLLVTIRSRCQRYDFRRIRATEVVTRLKYICEQEGLEIDNDALYLIAREGDGSLRDSLSVLDQVIAFGGEAMSAAEVANLLGVADRTRVTEMISALLNRDTLTALSALASAHNHGMELKVFAKTLAMEARDLLMVRMMGRNARDLVDRSASEVDSLNELITGVDDNDLQRLSHVLLELAEQMATAAHPRLVMEMTLIRLCRTPKLKDVAALAAQVDRLVMTGRLPTAAAPRLPQAGRSAPRQSRGRSTQRRAGDDDVPVHRPEGPPASTRPVPAPTQTASSSPTPTPAKPTPAPPQAPVANGPVLSDADLPKWIAHVSGGAHSALVPTLENAVVSSATPGRLLLGFASKYFADNASRPEPLKALRQTAKAVFGAAVEVEIHGVEGRARTECVQAKREARIEGQRAANWEALNNHSSVTRALAVLGGEINRVDLAPIEPEER